MLLVMTGLIVKNTDRRDVYEVVKYKILDLESCEEFDMSLAEIDSNDISVMGIYDAEFNAMHNGEKVYHRGGSENYDALYYAMGGRTYKGSEFTILTCGNAFVLGVVLVFLASGYFLKSSHNDSVTDLNNTTTSVCGDTLDSVINNVKYLSRRYDNKVESFKFMYGDNIISKEQYVNDILNEFYKYGL